MLTTLLLLAAPVLPLQDAQATAGRATVFRVDEVRTLDGKTLKNATVVVREGVITSLGEAVVVPENAEVHDLRGTGAVMTPPLAVASSSFLARGSRGGLNARFLAAQSLRLADDWADALLEEGVLVIGVDPPGAGMPGRTSVLLVGQEGPLVHDLHLKIDTGVGSNKKLVRDALAAADKAIDGEEKARDKWKKEREEWEAKQKEKAEAEKKAKEGGKEEGGAAAAQQGGNGRGQGKGGEQEDKEPPKEFEPPKIDPNVEPVVEWIRKQRVAQVRIGSAADWLHWQELLGDRELPYQLVLDMEPSRFSGTTSTNLHEVKEAIAATGLRVLIPAVPAERTFLPYTRIRMNLPAELVDAGLEKLVLLPPMSSPDGIAAWRTSVAMLAATGLDADRALRAMTVDAAAALGQEELSGPLKAGAPANFVVWSGAPLDAMARALYVVHDGETIYDRARAEEEEER